MSKNYLVSVVMPIYNSEKYLAKSVDSVLSQSMGFEKNIQLILVNDGSTDSSETICQDYQKKYPDNIIYLKQEHKGVSAARNLGIGSVRGRYVNFLDSDDCWTEDALKKLTDFFEENYESIDIAAARKVLFDGANGFHGLDYKFASTGVIDLVKRFDIVHMDVTSALIKTEAIGEKRFCEQLRYGEDARFMNELLLEKCTLGVVREAEHRFRMRTDGTAALQRESETDGYYFDAPELVHRYLFDLSMKKYGEIRKFIQYSMMYDLTWRVKKPVYKLLEKERFDRYRAILVDLLQNIEDEIIYKQHSIYMNMKMYCLSLKYGHDVRKDLKYDKGLIKYKDFVTIDLDTAKTLLIWDYFELHGNILRLEGKDNCWMRGNDYNYYVKVAGEVYYPSYIDCPKFDLVTMDGIVNKGRAVVYEIHLNPNKETQITFFYRKGDDTREIYTSLGRFSHLPKTEGGYYARGNFIIRANEKGILVQPYNEEKRNELEKNYRRLLTEQGHKNAVEWRKRYFAEVQNKKRDIWLISDRTYVANDNGEHFFRYMNKWQHKARIDTYFNINQDCDDYQRMKKIGKVIPYGTDEYRMKFLLSDKIISSSVSDYLFNPFGEDLKYLVDLLGYEFVFLQHGITKDDLSSWLNRYNKNISMIVTAAVPEYLSFVNGNYCLTKDIPVLTGMARFDALYKKGKKRPKKKIVIIPTWRQSIKGSFDPKANKSVYFDKFKETEYYRFYQSLINDVRLLKAMREYGYTGLLCMHPMHSEQWRDFQSNDVFAVNDGLVNYQQEFIESAVLVTDYSSVAFDFAYLRKPVVYTQFDKEAFYQKHTYQKGYFDYEKDGFGRVCYDKDAAVDALIALLKNGCRNDEKYLQRVDDFYPFRDAHCCRRVYDCIKDLKYKYGAV